jgi:hypothetical protein
MVEEEVVRKHRHRDEVSLTCTSRPYFYFGEKGLKALDHDLIVDKLLTMASRVKSVPTL